MGVRRYNTISLKEKDFYEWLCGFTGGEGMFYIEHSKAKLSNNFVFKFGICLHVDDKEVLLAIHKILPPPLRGGARDEGRKVWD